MLNSGKANQSGRKAKAQRSLIISPDKQQQMGENVENDQADECPSTFDENEFDEDHPVPMSHNMKSSKHDHHLAQNDEF